MLLVIDNYDSFTYNLVQYFYEMNQEVEVYRNDAISVPEIREKSPDFLVISPGPCTPKEAGISVEVIREFSGQIPILGVCLGHQSIGSAYGADIIKANEIMHGKISKISHNGKGIFKNVEEKFLATRYHSLTIEESSLSEDFEITARSEDGTIMAIQHKSDYILVFNSILNLLPQNMERLCLKISWTWINNEYKTRNKYSCFRKKY